MHTMTKYALIIQAMDHLDVGLDHFALSVKHIETLLKMCTLPTLKQPSGK